MALPKISLLRHYHPHPPHDHHNDHIHLNSVGDIAVAKLPGGVAILHLYVLAQAAEECVKIIS